MLTSVWVLGLTIVTQEKMGLYILRDKLTNDNLEAKKRIYDPLLVCHWCMPSIHSLFAYAAAIGFGWVTSFSWKLVILYPFVVAASSLTCGLVWMIYKTLEAAHTYFSNGQKMFYLNIQSMKEERNNQQQNKVKRYGN